MPKSNIYIYITFLPKIEQVFARASHSLFHFSSNAKLFMLYLYRAFKKSYVAVYVSYISKVTKFSKKFYKVSTGGNMSVAIVPTIVRKANHSYCTYSNLILSSIYGGATCVFLTRQLEKTLIWKFGNESIGKYFFAEKKLPTSNFRLPTSKKHVILSKAKNLYADQEIGIWANSHMGTLKSAQRLYADQKTINNSPITIDQLNTRHSHESGNPIGVRTYQYKRALFRCQRQLRTFIWIPACAGMTDLFNWSVRQFENLKMPLRSKQHVILSKAKNLYAEKKLFTIHQELLTKNKARSAKKLLTKSY